MPSNSDAMTTIVEIGLQTAVKGNKKRAKAEHIFETLRNRICTLEYPPGFGLRETDLAAEFEVSRTPVREALHRLELSGLVQPMVGVGTIVTPIEINQLKDILNFRTGFARALPQFLDLSDVAATNAIFEDLKIKHQKLESEFSLALFTEASNASRTAIAGHISNPIARQIWTSTYYLSARFWYAAAAKSEERFVVLLREELDVLGSAFKHQDPDRLAHVIETTINTWADAILESLISR